MLTEQINNDLKEAMKAQDAGRLSTLRMLKSALKNKEIDLMHPLTDDEAIAIIKGQVKQLKEVQETEEKVGREEESERAKQEIAVLEKYLPAQMGEEELVQIVRDAVVASGATSKADTGKAMGAAMKAVAGRADGTRVKTIVETILATLVLFVALVLYPESAYAATATDAEFAISSARMARVFLMLMGIVSINFIIMGAISVMTSSGRDHGHHHGVQQIAVGIFGTILVAGLFTIASGFIEQLQ